MVRRGFCILGLTAFVLALASPVPAAERQFESPPVHPIELSPDGARLFAVNTPDHRLAIYDLTGGTPVLVTEIQVGIEPVTVRAHGNDEVWVVNHISDSISIIDLTTGTVKRTLVVGDEPTDVVFAGIPEKAFVCVSQEDRIRIYDTANLDAAPVVVDLDAADPRSLAVSADGTKVYVTVLDSGNETTVVPEAVVDTTLGLPPPNPPMDSTLAAPPKVSLIVRHDGVNWVDELSRSWDFAIPYRLYDNDVIEIDVLSSLVVRSFKQVGTSLFNVAVNPVTGRLYVTNIEAFNEIRFEPNLKGQFAQNRVTTIDPVTSTVTPVHLNQHINYGNPAGDPTERSLSLGLPLDVCVNSSGDTVYVAAMGSNQVGVLDGAGQVLRRIPVGQGPVGLALDEPRNRLYVLNRHFGSVSVVDLTDDSSVEVELGFDPTPLFTQVGRTLFYGTPNSSAHGDLACATCHLFTNMDGLAWDLGDPTGPMTPKPQPQSDPMHPMKGPLITQSLKGLTGTQPLHWRGDRPNLEAFNISFVDLQGRPDTLSAFDMSLFKDFVESVFYPPNPLRNLDGTLQDPPSGPNPKTGENLFFNGGLVNGSNCDFCHAMPTGTSGTIFPKLAIVENQSFESPQFRNMYEKTGLNASGPWSVRGYGFTHEGDEPSIFSFTFSPIFSFQNDQQRVDVEAFLHRFPTGTHATTGQQLTLDGTNELALAGRLDTLIAVADSGGVGLVAKGVYGGVPRGWMYDPGAQNWRSDRSWAGRQTTAELKALAGAGTELTVTAVVIGCETRLGVDRDADGWFDQDEVDAGTDPGDPASFPTSLATPGEGAAFTGLERAMPNPASAHGTTVSYRLAEDGPLALRVFDVQGRLVRTLVEGVRQPAGAHRQEWDLRDDAGRRVQAGIYFIKLTSGTTVAAQRLVVLR